MIGKRILALLLSIGSAAAITAAPVMTAAQIPLVEYVTPRLSLYEKRVNCNGTIESQNVKEIYLETPVIASDINVGVGDEVQKDQVLAIIDTKLTKSVVEQSIPTSMILQNIPSEDISSLLDLYSAFSSSGLTGGSLEEVIAAYASASEISQETLTPNTLAYIPEVITAPMDGVVTQLSIKTDVLSRTATPVISIADANNYIAKVTVGESYISSIKLGDPCIIKGTGFSGKQYSGYVSKIYPVARKMVGSVSQETVVDVEIKIDNPDRDLKSGFSARAEIITDQQKNILTVPYEAVQQDENDIEYVYAVQGSRTVRRDITTGMELSDGVEVVEGLEEKDIIIADSSKIEKEGQMVSLKGG